MPGDQSFIFIGLLALTVGTVALVLMQVLFGLLEVKKRRLAERLGAAPEANYAATAGYGSIRMDDKTADIPSMLAQSQAVQAFHGKLARAYPGVDLKKFALMIVAFAITTGTLTFLWTQSIVAALFC